MHSPRLVDKFHNENTYLICLSDNRIVGMIAARGRRPFSLDQKLPNLDSYLPPGRRTCEIRLLSVEKEFRNGQVFRGLTALMWQYGLEHGYDLAVISGTTRQQKLYRHLGFVPFGPPARRGEAIFQPMYLTLENFEKQAEEFLREPIRPRGPASFLPGPVSIHPLVRRPSSVRPNPTGRTSSSPSFKASASAFANWCAPARQILLGSAPWPMTPSAPSFRWKRNRD